MKDQAPSFPLQNRKTLKDPNKNKLILKVKEEYDPNEMPPSLSKATNHMRASKVSRECASKTGEMCGCCGRFVEREELKIFCDIIELAFLGSGYPMYFEFLKFCGILMGILLVISGIFSMITNGVFGKSCIYQSQIDQLLSEQEDQCLKNWVTIVSLGNKRSENHLMTTQSFLNVLSIFVIIGAFQKFRYEQRKIDINCDETDLAANDYTILLEGIPKLFSPQQTQVTKKEIPSHQQSIIQMTNNDSKTKIIAQTEINKNKASHSNSNKNHINETIVNLKPIQDNLQVNNETIENGQKSNHGEQNLPQYYLQQDKEQKIQQLTSNENPSAHKNNNVSLINFNEELKSILENNLLPNRIVEIVKVGLCFDCKELNRLRKKIESLVLKKQICKAMNHAKENVDQIDEKIVKKRKKFNIEQQKYLNSLVPQFFQNHFTGYAYVIFQKEEDKERVIEEYKQRGYLERLFFQKENKQFKIKESIIEIEQAPDPNNIYWKNLKYTEKQKKQRRIICLIISILALLACLGAVIGLAYSQEQTDDGKQGISSSLISFVLSIIITILNPALRFLSLFIAWREGRSTRTSLFVAVAVRSSIAQFVNTSILLVITQVFISQNGNVYGNIFGPNGLALNVNTVFITQLISTNILKLLNIPHIIITITRKILTKYQKKMPLLTQNQLNSFFEEPEFDIQEEYSYTLSIIYSTVFFAPFFPMCLIWGILQITAKYWIDKYNLIRKSTVKFNPSFQLCLQMTEMLEYSLPIYSLANMLSFIYITNSEVSTLSIFGFIIGLAHAIFPMQAFNEKLFKTKERQPNFCTYNDINSYFTLDYDRENPAIKEAAIEDRIINMKSRFKSVQSQRVFSNIQYGNSSKQISQLKDNQENNVQELKIQDQLRQQEKNLEFEKREKEIVQQLQMQFSSNLQKENAQSQQLKINDEKHDSSLIIKQQKSSKQKTILVNNRTDEENTQKKEADNQEQKRSEIDVHNIVVNLIGNNHIDEDALHQQQMTNSLIEINNQNKLIIASENDQKAISNNQTILNLSNENQIKNKKLKSHLKSKRFESEHNPKQIFSKLMQSNSQLVLDSQFIPDDYGFFLEKNNEITSHREREKKEDDF